ncbi:unnamed protein product [Nesidiocoris tenuis]|uniref:RNA-directed DNA polymerase n=1 Tax=Nesidiocoris tenuis TaxID=355587 RepID=A0A6H5GP33_9HEMI|nr:unnamed protein product [Nesidiocoris tenuis]
MKSSRMTLNPSENCFSFNFTKNNFRLYSKPNLPTNFHLAADNEIDKHSILQDLKIEFPSVLTDELGCTDRMTYSITLKKDADFKPCRTVYQLSPPKMTAMKEILDTLLSNGTIEKIQSPIASPCFLVDKKSNDGTKKYRLVVDYRALNKEIEYFQYPLPTVESAFMYLNGARFFTCLDLNQAFHQIPLDRASQRLTAFQTPFGCYCYKRLPFGVAVGSQALSCLMDEVLGDLKYTFVFNFQDDVFIYSETLADHLQHIRIVLTRLQEAKLTVNLTKASIARSSIDFLGHTIRHNKITMNPDRVKHLLAIPKPTSPKEISQFLGAVNFFAKFFPDLATVVEPLNSLRGTKSALIWNDQCDSAWHNVRQLIASAPILKTPDFSEKFCLFTDASTVGLGVCLGQSVDNKIYPVAFASRKLKPAERNYSAYELEMLAVIFGVTKFRVYLETTKFDLFTDHKALTTLTKVKQEKGRLIRWQLLLMPFRYEAHHISGSNNGFADYLSRFPTEDADPEIPATVHLAVTIPEIFKDITEEQRKDPQLQAIINQLQSGSKPEQYKLVGQKLVYERPPGVLKLAVPAHMKDFIYEYFHTSLYGCHQGADRTVAKIKALFHWPALEQFVRQKIQKCLPCQRSKPDQSGAKGHLSSFLTSKPNEKLFIDVAGPLPMSDGYHFVFIAVDAFSRFVFLIPLRKATSETVIKSLQNHIFNNFGLWNSVCSDNDTIFTSKRFTTFLFSHGIHHQRLIRHYPNPNLAERQIKNMKSAIIAFHAEDQTKWSQDLPFIQAALNSALVSSTGFTPARIFLGRELLTPLHLRWDESNQSSDASIPPPADLWKVVYENLVRAHRKMQRDYNSKHKNMQFSVGDLVLLKTYILSNKLKHVSTKLSFRYSDPYEITKIKSPVTYELKNVANPEDLKLAHVSQLKKFLPKRSAIRSD